jgi:deoxyadenosine/deoxycytidine kinase
MSHGVADGTADVSVAGVSLAGIFAVDEMTDGSGDGKTHVAPMPMWPKYVEVVTRDGGGVRDRDREFLRKLAECSCHPEIVRVIEVESARASSRAPGKVLFLEGGIGAGKSTAGWLMVALGSILERTVVFFEEPKNRRALTSYIKNAKTEALSFQILMLSYRFRVLDTARALALLGYVVVLDRSIYGDRVFEYVNYLKENISQQQHEFYEKYFWGEMANRRKHAVTVEVFYLPQTVEESLRKIARRGIKEEIEGYTTEYLGLINDTYATCAFYLSFDSFASLRFPFSSLIFFLVPFFEVPASGQMFPFPYPRRFCTVLRLTIRQVL